MIDAEAEHSVHADLGFLRVVEAQVSFTNDDSGAVNGMILHQGGRNRPGSKVR